MLNNYIGGGQVFLHKIRMFMQVFKHSLTAALIIGAIIGIGSFYPLLMKQDFQAALSYRKAYLANSFESGINPIRESINPRKNDHITLINTKTKAGVYQKDIDPRIVIRLPVFKQADAAVMGILTNMFYVGGGSAIATFIIIFILWWKFGKSIKSDHKVKGEEILSDVQVSSILHNTKMASDFKIGKMPLVKDSETKHFLICGATGSGKTNLIDTLLPQVIAKKQAAIVIDQTGEMISKYYNPARGDIIINPLDDRSHNWDFWTDCFEEKNNNERNNARLETFAKIIFGFNKREGSNNNSFWDESAEMVFTSCAEYLYKRGETSISKLQDMLQLWSFADLEKALQDTPAGKHIHGANKVTASSILSVTSTSAKPLYYLREGDIDKSFSFINHLKQVKDGSEAWLFLATKPSQRKLTLPLIAAFTELAVSLLMENGIRREQRLWFVFDELAALGRLPALKELMNEGRKYGACVTAAMQSINQLYSNYGQNEGSAIFGQFASKFFFRNDEPQIAKMITELFGTEHINRQQKNTSFGANEFRDGVSYTEQEKEKKLVEYSDIASLGVGECFVVLPETQSRLVKIKVPEVMFIKSHKEFIPNAYVGSGLESENHPSQTLEKENLTDKNFELTNLIDLKNIDSNYANENKKVDSKEVEKEENLEEELVMQKN